MNDLVDKAINEIRENKVNPKDQDYSYAFRAYPPFGRGQMQMDDVRLASLVIKNGLVLKNRGGVNGIRVDMNYEYEDNEDDIVIRFRKIKG